MTDVPDSEERRLVVIQRNPVSGSGRRRSELLRCVRQLQADGFRVRMFRSRRHLDAWVADPAVRRQLRCIIAAGGDGTVADLMNRQPGVALIPFPFGTENLVARYLRIRRDGARIAGIIRGGHTRQLDVAVADGREFLLMLSVGVDANIVSRVHSVRTGHIRRLSYLRPIVQEFFTGTPRPVRVSAIDSDAVAAGGHVVITNIPSYGFGFQMAPDATPDDGQLDVRVLPSLSRLRILLHAVTLWLSPRLAERGVTRFRAAEIRIEAADDLPPPVVQADGDPFLSLPLTVRILPARLKVMIPAASADVSARHDSAGASSSR